MNEADASSSCVKSPFGPHSFHLAQLRKAGLMSAHFAHKAAAHLRISASPCASASAPATCNAIRLTSLNAHTVTRPVTYGDVANRHEADRCAYELADLRCRQRREVAAATASSSAAAAATGNGSSHTVGAVYEYEERRDALAPCEEHASNGKAERNSALAAVCPGDDAEKDSDAHFLTSALNRSAAQAVVTRLWGGGATTRAIRNDYRSVSTSLPQRIGEADASAPVYMYECTHAPTIGRMPQTQEQQQPQQQQQQNHHVGSASLFASSHASQQRTRATLCLDTSHEADGRTHGAVWHASHIPKEYHMSAKEDALFSISRVRHDWLQGIHTSLRGYYVSPWEYAIHLPQETSRVVHNTHPHMRRASHARVKDSPTHAPSEHAQHYYYHRPPSKRLSVDPRHMLENERATKGEDEHGCARGMRKEGQHIHAARVPATRDEAQGKEENSENVTEVCWQLTPHTDARVRRRRRVFCAGVDTERQTWLTRMRERHRREMAQLRCELGLSEQRRSDGSTRRE